MTRIEHQTLNERAYIAIKRGLVSGIFVPGQALRIRKLADQYGISTTPVREALQRLVAERLLVMRPNRSIGVPPLSSDTFWELARIRCALEGLAGELATPRFGPAEIKALRGIIQQIETSLTRHDVRAYLRHNQRLHFAIYQRAEAPLLLGMIQDLWSRVGPFLAELFTDTDYLPHANEYHRRILCALEAGDAAGVREGLAADISVAAQSLAPRLTRQDETGRARNPARLLE